MPTPTTDYGRRLPAWKNNQADRSLNSGAQLRNKRLAQIAKRASTGPHITPRRRTRHGAALVIMPQALPGRTELNLLGHSELQSSDFFLLSVQLPLLFLCLTGAPDSLIALSRRTAAAAAYFTSSLSSDMYNSTVSRTEGSPRSASASSAAARTTQLLSPTASASALVVAGSGSLMSTLAAAARTGDESSLWIALNVRHPIPANGIKPIPS